MEREEGPGFKLIATAVWKERTRANDLRHWKLQVIKGNPEFPMLFLIVHVMFSTYRTTRIQVLREPEVFKKSKDPGFEET